MAPLSPGRIVWAVYPGNRGDGKTRPMIVVSRRTDILRTGQGVAVVCSTDFAAPFRSAYIREHPILPIPEGVIPL